MRRRRVAAVGMALALAWSGVGAGHELVAAWRALPPRFERIPGALRWHDREARRLRSFVAAVREVAPPEAGRWCWESPGRSAHRGGELFQWAAFLAPEHDLLLAATVPSSACDLEVQYLGLAGTPPADELGDDVVLTHSFGVLVRLPPRVDR